MGSVGTLFRRPRQYARFLGQELFFVYKGRLLVVMLPQIASTKSHTGDWFLLGIVALVVVAGGAAVVARGARA